MYINILKNFQPKLCDFDFLVSTFEYNKLLINSKHTNDHVNESHRSHRSEVGWSVFVFSCLFVL